MRLNEEVESVEELPDGKVAANLVSKKRLIADALLYAVGRAGNVDELNLAAANITGRDAPASPETVPARTGRRATPPQRTGHVTARAG